jgi:hypothetical protein
VPPVLLGAILAAAVSTAAAPASPAALPVAQRGMHCPGGGRAIGDRVGKTYILQELQIVTRNADQKLVGFIYSGADGNDYIDLSPSVQSERTRLMRDGEPDKTTTMMRYCFSEPWHA